MPEQKIGLTVRELLTGAYDKLSKQQSNREFILLTKLLTEIADDSDGHRTRTGYMSYGLVRLAQFGNKSWAIARGEKCGSYPGDVFDSDIMAFEFPLNTRGTKSDIANLDRMIKESSYFKNTLLIGTADGLICASPRGKFGKPVIRLIGPSVNSYIAREAEYDPELLSVSTLKPLVKKTTLYKPEFVDFLAEGIRTVLETS